MSTETVDLGKRRFLTAATSAVGAVGAAFVAVPFVKSMSPSARAQAAGAPVEADISKMEPGQMLTVEWRGKPVWIVRRTEETLNDLKALDGILSDPACHGSRFDLAGRVYQGVPAPTNLVIPPHNYVSDTRILIGVDQGAA